MLRATDSKSFDEFWQAYPRHHGKKDAQQVWAKLNPSIDTLADILKALDWQRVEWAKRPAHFTPMAETWLRGERWNDEPFHPPLHAKGAQWIGGSRPMCVQCKRVVVDRLGNFCAPCKQAMGLTL